MKIRLLSIYFIGCLLGTFIGKSLGWCQLENRLKTVSQAPILYLKGSPYELGLQHGHKLKEAIAYNIKRFVDDRMLSQSEHPQIKSFLAQLPQVLDYIPQDYLQELKGLAEGAEVPYEKVLLLNLFPEMFHCSAITVQGQATQGEEIYHVRVLDYGIGIDLQDTAVLMVVQPKGKIPFINVSYAGFIGCITGMNAQKIAVGEIGGKGYGNYQGLPMAFLLRSILEKASHLHQVRDILTATARTCEYYYVFSDGKAKESIGVYATQQQLQFIETGTSYALFDSSFSQENSLSPMAVFNKMVLHSGQIDFLPYQTVLYKDVQKQQLWGVIFQQLADCLVLTGFSHPSRYSVIVQRLAARYGQIGVRDLQEIIQGEAGRPSNLHTVIFSPTTLEAWIAQAGPNGEPAWGQPYRHINFSQLLED